jgi:redox-regulated HSP33 family molecular chaperone
MTPTVIDYRNIQARQRIKRAAGALADALNLAPLGEIEAVEKRQPAVAQMRELEHIAGLLESVARALLQETKL